MEKIAGRIINVFRIQILVGEGEAGRIVPKMRRSRLLRVLEGTYDEVVLILHFIEAIDICSYLCISCYVLCGTIP